MLTFSVVLVKGRRGKRFRVFVNAVQVGVNIVRSAVRATALRAARHSMVGRLSLRQRCTYACMYVCMYVFMYVRTYILYIRKYNICE